MIRPIAIALVALSLTACITVEIPAPEYPELPEATDAVNEAEDALLVDKPKSEVSVAKRSTHRPADTPLPAATVHPGNSRPDTS